MCSCFPAPTSITSGCVNSTRSTKGRQRADCLYQALVLGLEAEVVVPRLPPADAQKVEVEARPMTRRGPEASRLSR